MAKGGKRIVFPFYRRNSRYNGSQLNPAKIFLSMVTIDNGMFGMRIRKTDNSLVTLELYYSKEK